LSGGAIPLALTVLMVLALDIGTDLLPALALGAEPPDEGALDGPSGDVRLVDGALLRRAFLVLGPVEAAVEMAVFSVVLLTGGWHWGATPDTHLLLTASGAAFATVVLGQLANAFACRSDHQPVWRVPPGSNPLLIWAVGFELAALGAFLWVPALSSRLELSPPTTPGWALAALAIPAVLLADAAEKSVRRRRLSAP
jgi:magnesium-transporting ATPase (P-type)